MIDPRFAWLLLAGALAGCGREVTTDRAAPVSTAVAAAPHDSAARAPALQVQTILYSEHDADIRSRIDRAVQSYQVDLGEYARAGQLLAVLEDGEERAAADAATAALGLARAEHDRAVSLRAKELITQAELDQAVYRLRAAEAALQMANVRLAYTRIRAPFAGAISRRFIRIGQLVEEGDPLFRVTALYPLRAQVRVPEADARGLALRQRVRVRGVAGADGEGTVSRIAPAVDPASGTVEVLVDVARPGELRPGSAVVVEFPRRTASAGR